MLYSSACENAIRAMTFLAQRPAERRTPLAEIAAAEDLPHPFLGKVSGRLVRAGLLRSARGPMGGFVLARPASEISLLDIRAALDGTEDLEACAVGLDPCSDDTPCPLHETWKSLRTALKEYLKRTTLADMAEGVARKRALIAAKQGADRA